MFIDTHCHLYDEAFDPDRLQVIESAFASGIEMIFMPNVEAATVDGMLQLEVAHPGRIYAMMGLHPCSVGDDPRKELEIVEEHLAKRSFCAVGEIGLDLYWRQDNLEQQLYAFRQQVEMANSYNLPVILHSRNSNEEILNELEGESKARNAGIMHCFSGTLEQAQRAIALGFYLGIGGVVTYKNGGLDKILSNIPLEHLVLETDAPYLPPVPNRGKRNEPSFLLHVAAKVAEIYGTTLEQVATITNENAKRIFRK